MNRDDVNDEEGEKSWRKSNEQMNEKGGAGGKEERFTCAHMKPFEEEASVIVGAI